MADGDIVASGVVQVEYIIREYVVDGRPAYDYISGPVESEEYFDSIEAAEAEAKRVLDY